ncbi:prolipoprotein diacylglyceryl transferase [Flammeovirga aprica]|uniref:Phosphatidylglycerol--prolipoprotein diacylglyceryl transferase n=1 Tax=Flammeovirga aprica JL-4 TaxID=694437 RepID=A0A7X9RUZ8_9BACT|nr:prolipoprotein diacylglyceryl transferase [Flammeovirga aprica]NME69201.1 prolipoprotein diacylglyceryl transferase [Flammeovirga aprica JL-4]
MLNYIIWNPDPEILDINGFPLRYYGVLFVTGVFLSSYFLSRIFEKEGLPQSNHDRLLIYAVLGIFIGARLGHCLLYEPAYFLSNPLEMIFPIQFLPDGSPEFVGYAGLASHGGGIGLTIALILYARKTNHHFIDIVDLLAVVIGIACAFIRLANLMNSEIIGTPTDLPWAFVFERIDLIPRHPAQLYEAVCYFIIFGIMMYLYQKHRTNLKSGFLSGTVIILIFSSRFLIEFIKENQVPFEEGLSFNMGQMLSIPYILIGVCFIIYGRKRSFSDVEKQTDGNDQPSDVF